MAAGSGSTDTPGQTIFALARYLNDTNGGHHHDEHYDHDPAANDDDYRTMHQCPLYPPER